MPSSIPRSDSIPGLSTLESVVPPPVVHVLAAPKEDVSDSASTADTARSETNEREEINVESWSLVGRKIFESLAAADSDDDFEEPPVDVKNWSAVASRIRQKLLDFPEDSD